MMSEQPVALAGGYGSPQSRALALVAAGLVWAIGIGLGMHRLWQYSYGSEPGARPPVVWPKEASVSPHGSLPTLLMFVHPRCPCTRASIEELARLMRFARERLAVTVCVFSPTELHDGWERTELWASAQAIPGVAMYRDRDAREAQRFQAVKSGTVLLYSPAGRLLFSGGITNGRGHEGDSVGRATILALLEGRPAPEDPVPAFGCPIYQPRASATCDPDAAAAGGRP